MRFINRHPGRRSRLLLGLLPLALLMLVYVQFSRARLAANPDDRLLPSIGQMAHAIRQMAFTEDKRTGEHLMWADTLASLRRLGCGLGIAALLGLCLGISAGSFPLLGATLSPLLALVSMIPPLAVLPILFIIFGLDDFSKIMLIVIGITPLLARDLEQHARGLPREMMVKAQTLGANSWTIVLRVILPQMLARLMVSLRLILGAAWLFLISAEAISATAGLGYRIFLVRRYMAMDIILPYVLWITLLAWFMDQALHQCKRWWFPWSVRSGA